MSISAQAALRFGVFFPPIHAPTQSPTLRLQDDLRQIVDLDRLGYDEVWVGEHHSSGWEYVGSPEVFIANALPRTTRIRFGTGVVSIPYHNPFMVAERMMLLDHLSQGRVMLGLGPGALPYDAHQLGLDVMQSRRQLEEGLDVVLALFRGETVTRESDWFRLRDARLQLAPYSLPHMEVIVSASVSPAGPKLAGKYGTSLLSINATGPGAFDALRGRWAIVEEEAVEYGQTVDRGGWRLVAPMLIAPTEAEAIREAGYGLAQWVDYMLNVSGLVPAGKNPFGIAPGDGGDVAVLAKSVVESGFAVIGSPDQAVEMILRLVEQTGGFGTLLLWATDWASPEATRRSYDLFAREVIPGVRGCLRAQQNNQAWVKSLHGEIAGNAGRAREQASRDYENELKERAKRAR